MERYKTMLQPFYKDQEGGTIELTQNINSLINIKSELDLNSNHNNLETCEDNYYQLHHFMMGKGKSAIITPLLSLHLNIIKKKKTIYIIVPKHLVKQTESTLRDYIDIFQIQNIYIKSEDDIKNEFLEGKFIINTNLVFLIDEFDSLMNPLKSNFNYILKKNLNIDDINNLIKEIIEENKETLYKNENISIDNLLKKINKNKKISNKPIFAKNLFSIIEQLNKKKLKYNIQWGIDSDFLYAIPFRSKDKPIENSSFMSCIQTIFLTYYYYVIIMKYKLDKNIINFIKKNKYLKKIFRIDNSIIDIDTINNILENELIKKEFFDTLFKEISSKIELPEEQYNTSFIDIINIDNVIKIGYSGTININLPKLENHIRFDQNCLYRDEDESTNIEYAIRNSIICKFEMVEYLDNLFDYDALIDVCGYFYKNSNYDIALEIYNKLKREVIFIDEKDEKMIIKNNRNLEKLNENTIYENPFFYYDQGHIVGIDIKQDNYPELHGLFIVDNLSYYSEVAQAIFRLRKLNMGHKIAFILNNFKIENQQLLLNHFRQNEEKLIEKQQDNLNLQAFKSDIRKKRKNDIFRERYKEYLFYYFKNKPNDDQLNLILNEDEKKTINLNFYNLNIEKVNKIIYNLDFENIEVQHKVSTQVLTQVQLQMQTQIQPQNDETFNSLKDIILKKFRKYKFKSFNFVKDITNQINYNKYTFKLNNILSFLPNIFYNNSYNPNYCVVYEEYHYNFDLIFIYIHQIEKFIIIPKYMLFYLYNNFIMYDFNFNILNNNKIKFHNINKVNELENNLFAKIITNNFMVNDFKLFSENLLTTQIIDDIRGSYLIAFIYLFKNQYELQNKLYGKFIEIVNLKLLEIIETLNFAKHDSLIRNVIKPPKENLIQTKKFYSPSQSPKPTLYPQRWKNKYLKYKQKYLKLKELMGIN